MRRRFLVLALSLAASGRAAAIELDANQVLIEATIVSITEHDAMALGIAAFEPGERIDAPTELQLETSLFVATAQTQSVITAIQGNASLAASPVGARALDDLELARAEQLRLQDLLDEDDFPKARVIIDPVVLGRSFQQSAVIALQGRPERTSPGKRAARDAIVIETAYIEQVDFFESLGLPDDLSALFEPFSGGKGKALIEGTGFEPAAEARVAVRKGALEISALSKEPTTSGVDFGVGLSENFTVVITMKLPAKGGGKPRDELEGFSAGVKVTTDSSSNPAEAFFIEHQTSAEGWGQTFTSSKTAVIDVFPHATSSLTREITSFIVKEGDSLVLGALLKDGPNQTLIQSDDIPVVGNLPVLGFYFRNGTRKTPVQADNLLIFVTPHVIEGP